MVIVKKLLNPTADMLSGIANTCKGMFTNEFHVYKWITCLQMYYMFTNGAHVNRWFTCLQMKRIKSSRRKRTCFFKIKKLLVKKRKYIFIFFFFLSSLAPNNLWTCTNPQPDGWGPLFKTSVYKR